MSYYDRIDLSERAGINKTNEALYVFTICHYYYFHKINSRFQPKVCDIVISGDGCQKL